jgi:hypothetical protein
MRRKRPQVLGVELNRSESSPPVLPFAPPHSQLSGVEPTATMPMLSKFALTAGSRRAVTVSMRIDESSTMFFF